MRVVIREGGLLTTGSVVNGSVVSARVNDPFAYVWFWVVMRYYALWEIGAIEIIVAMFIEMNVSQNLSLQSTFTASKSTAL